MKDQRRLGKGLEDISHLFLSEDKKKETSSRMESVSEEGKTPSPKENAPRVVAITGDHRSLEKSFLVCNLAVELTRRKRRIRVVDADLSFPDQSFLWGLRPGDSIARLALEDDGHDLQISRQGPLGIQLLSLDVDLGRFARLPEPAHRRFWSGLMAFEADAQLLLVDTPAYPSENTRLIHRLADQIIVLVPSDPLGMMDAYWVIKSILTTRPNAPLGIVIYNVRMMAEAQAISRQMIQTVGKFLDARATNFGYLYADINIERSISQRTPLLLTTIRSRAAKCLTHIAERVWIQKGVRAEEQGHSFFHSLSKMVGKRS